MSTLQQYLPLAVLKLPEHMLIPIFKLQQYLPLAVLKRNIKESMMREQWRVTTVLTACGIETHGSDKVDELIFIVTTVLTACGIETRIFDFFWYFIWLQQYLPLAVLKLIFIKQFTD